MQLPWPGCKTARVVQYKRAECPSPRRTKRGQRPESWRTSTMPRCELVPITVHIVSQNFTFKSCKYGVFLKHVSTSWQLVASTKAPTLPPTMWPSSDLAVQRLIDSGYLRTFRIQSDTKSKELHSGACQRCCRVVWSLAVELQLTWHHTVYHTTNRVRNLATLKSPARKVICRRRMIARFKTLVLTVGLSGPSLQLEPVHQSDAKDHAAFWAKYTTCSGHNHSTHARKGRSKAACISLHWGFGDINVNKSRPTIPDTPPATGHTKENLRKFENPWDSKGCFLPVLQDAATRDRRREQKTQTGYGTGSRPQAPACIMVLQCSSYDFMCQEDPRGSHWFCGPL